jgi:5'-nucleotidase (lipoprotein e(P4) family)
MKNIAQLFFVGVVVLIGCKSAQKAADQATTPATTTPDQATLAVLWQQQSGEYQALCYQAYTIARLRLTEHLSQPKLPGALPSAIITDIDETILDNSPSQARDVLQNKTYNNDRWLQWVQQAQAKAVPGAVAFLKEADAKGIQIFYLSNRTEIELGKTIDNMQKMGFPQLTTNHFYLKTLTSEKEERRQKIAENHNVFMLIGDNLNDFEGAFYRKTTDLRNKLTTDFAAQFGNKFIVLPNPMYGDWEPALFNYKRLNELQTDSARKANLKGF